MENGKIDETYNVDVNKTERDKEAGCHETSCIENSVTSDASAINIISCKDESVNLESEKNNNFDYCQKEVQEVYREPISVRLPNKNSETYFANNGDSCCKISNVNNSECGFYESKSNANDEPIREDVSDFTEDKISDSSVLLSPSKQLLYSAEPLDTERKCINNQSEIYKPVTSFTTEVNNLSGSSSSCSNDSATAPYCEIKETEIQSFDSLSVKSSDIILNSVHSQESEESDLLSELESELDVGDSESSRTSSNFGPNGMTSLPSGSLSHSNLKHKKQKSGYRSKVNRPTVEYYEVQLEFLERTVSQFRRETGDLNDKLIKQEKEYKQILFQLRTELEAKVEKMTKQCEIAQKDKESMVVRYAQSEKEVIVSKKARDDLEKKMRDLTKDREGLIFKIKTLNTEKLRVSSGLENKMAELAHLQREYEKLKEDINSRDIRIKWAQNKLKNEVDAHKESQAKLEHTLQRLQEKREEAEQIRRDCQEMIKRYQEAEEIKSVSLDHQLKVKLDELEAHKQERSDQEEVFKLLKQEMDSLKKKHKLTIEENNALTVKINSLEKERLEYEQTVSKLKDSQNSLKQEGVDLTARLAEMENLKLQLEREKEKLSASHREIERLRLTNAELQTDMEACHNKEGELLEFTERLTARSVHLQSDHSLLENKFQLLEEELSVVNKKCTELEHENSKLITQLTKEKKCREEETMLLAKKLAEKTKLVEQLSVKLDEADNENKVMKRRHITSIKELARELQQTKKRLESFEFNQSAVGENLSLGSRASSTGSLDTMANNHSTVHNGPSPIPQQPPSVPPLQPPVVFIGGKTTVNSQQKHPSQASSPPSTTLNVEVDKNLLIERIVKVQKALARKNEKIEFLEEHINQLLAEMKKKTKIIQSYIVREETGALVSNSMDQNKLELSKRGGIMASVYSSHLSDSHMTLELSLEINHKLQAVLEDTLLKNITLKENINTLGEEIARLTKIQRELHNQLLKIKTTK